MLPELTQDNDIGSCLMSLIPATAYSNLEQTKKEIRYLLENCWIPLVNQPAQLGKKTIIDPVPLLNSGDWIPIRLLGEELILKRTNDGQLRCFLNMCPHARAKILDEPCAGDIIICPVHDRMFDENGASIYQPAFADSSARMSPLRQFAVHEIFPGLAFVNFGDVHNKFTDAFPEFCEAMECLPSKSVEYRAHSKALTRMKCDPKTQIYLSCDCKHIYSLHKELAKRTVMEGYASWIFEQSILQAVPAKNPEDGMQPDMVPMWLRARSPLFATYWSLGKPLNTFIKVEACGATVYAYLPIPGRAGFTDTYWLKFSFGDEELYKQADSRWLNSLVNREDREILPRFDACGRSSLSLPGELSPEEAAGPQGAFVRWYQEICMSGNPLA